MSEPVMSMYASKEECLQARADYFKSQRDKLHEALRAAMDDIPGWYDLARAAIAETEASK